VSVSFLPSTARRADAAALPLPVQGWGVAEALAALDDVRRMRPGLLAAGTPIVVQALTTVVLRSGDLAVKVYPLGTDAARLDAVHAALTGCTSVSLPLAPASVTPHGVVTVAPWVPGARPVSWPLLGALLHRFHDEAAGAPLPPWAPLTRLAEGVATLVPEHAEVLMNAREVVLDALDAVPSVLGQGAIHGDLSPSNALRGPTGPLLIDLDWVAIGPREYDLASAARRLRSGQLSRSTYARFCAAYGHDVRAWAGLPLVDLVADLSGVAFRLWDDRHHGRPLDWLPAEIARWRDPLSRAG